MSLRYIDEPLGEEPGPAPQPRQLRPRYLPEHDGPPKRPRIPESTAELPSYQTGDFVAGWGGPARSGPSPSVSRPPKSDHLLGLTYEQNPSAGFREWRAVLEFARKCLAQDTQTDEPRE